MNDLLTTTCLAALSDPDPVEEQARCHISRLNIDALIAIFEIVADEERPNINYPVVEKCWMKIGHVCRFWRSLLFDMSTLWARDVCVFGLDGPFEELLIRTHDAPIVLSSYEVLPQRIRARIAQLMERSRVLKCCIKSPEDYQSITEAFHTQRLPALDYLHVELSYMIKDTVFQEPVLLAHDSRIRRLEIHDIKLFPSPNGHLTSLSIVFNTATRGFSIDEIITILLGNISLESLTLHTVLCDDRPARRDQPCITLPVLSRLNIGQYDEGFPQFDLLALLRIPSVRYINAYDSLCQMAFEVYDALLCISDACVGSPIMSRDAYTLSIMENTDIDMQLYPAGSAPGTDELFKFVVYPKHGGPATRADMLLTVLEHLSCTNLSDRVVDLVWHQRKRGGYVYWNVVFRLLPEVSSLMISGEAEFSAVFDALNSRRAEEPLPLSHLARLVLEHEGIEHESFPWMRLENTLRRRMATDRPIREFSLFRKESYEPVVISYTAFVARLGDLAGRIGIRMSVQERKDVRGETAGVTFQFQY
ncbi:hypothetical protein PENSPDRAFT_653863 [Peniophora sp. CONT]|nr:hypothetical protein PENSPDRAFT_653863 [Peniophora sp. CONT]